MRKRQLYQCSHSKVQGETINCAKGHNLGIPIRQLERGDPLVINICQKCCDFDYMGKAIPPSERGWVKVNN